MKLIHLTNTEGKSPARSVKELKPSLGSSLKRSSQVKSSCPSCDSGASWMAAEVRLEEGKSYRVRMRGAESGGGTLADPFLAIGIP